MRTTNSVRASIARTTGLLIQALVLASAALTPLALSASASAAPQLSNRVAIIDTARPGQTFQVTFQFRLPSASAIQAAVFEFCDQPLGTCTTVNTPTIPGSSTVSQNGNWTNATAFGTYAQQNGANGGTGNQIKVSRTQVASETQSGVLDRSITFTGLTHNATANVSFYPRIRLYSDTAATALAYEGSVAQSTSQTLTVNARVQEVLSFCIGSTLVDNATSSIAADCSGITGTSVDLGLVDSNAIRVTPVAAINGGDLKNAVAMIQTNAVNGVSIAYKAVQDSASGKLKVVGAACTGVTLTDQCFNSQGTTQGTFTAGTEKFGMTIAGVNCASVVGYTCTFASGLTNLQPLSNYIGGTYTNGTSGTYGSTTGFAWDDSGSAQTIASSATSAVKVVANEALVLKFAATAGLTTPTGQYQVQSDFIATPTY